MNAENNISNENVGTKEEPTTTTPETKEEPTTTTPETKEEPTTTTPETKEEPTTTTPETKETKEDPSPPIETCFPRQRIICAGEYAIKTALNGPYANITEISSPILIEKYSRDIAKWSPQGFGNNAILGLDTNVDTHFWFQVRAFLQENENFISTLKDKTSENICGIVIVSSLWEAVGSALLPSLISQFKAWNINSAAIAMLPSQIQPLDVHFNAFSSIGLALSEDFAPIVLVARDQIERYKGVNRNGSRITGKNILSYLLGIISAKETFSQELSELSRALNISIFSPLLVTGASLSFYGSIENMLNSAIFRPLLSFELSNVSVLYVVSRIPIQLKNEVLKERIELEIANWFKEKASLRSIHVSEPIYVEELDDRIDILMLVGGFDTAKMFASTEKRVRDIKNDTIKKGLVKKDEWEIIVKNLIED